MCHLRYYRRMIMLKGAGSISNEEYSLPAEEVAQTEFAHPAQLGVQSRNHEREARSEYRRFLRTSNGCDLNTDHTVLLSNSLYNT